MCYVSNVNYAGVGFRTLPALTEGERHGSCNITVIMKTSVRISVYLYFS